MWSKNKKFLALSLAFVFTTLGCASVVGYEAGNGLEGVLESIQIRNKQATESSIISLVIASVVGVVVAGALLPTILSQTAQVQKAFVNGTAGASLASLWPLMIVVGVFVGIVSLAIGGVI
jgi:hypothetical protein